ncbi:MAG: hypothetical protein ACI9HG_002057 [Flavobacteriales bacterium]|jgi:hypothetical protein
MIRKLFRSFQEWGVYTSKPNTLSMIQIVLLAHLTIAKQLDNNGEFSYSEIIALEYNTAVELLSFYPNPTRTNINVSVKA